MRQEEWVEAYLYLIKRLRESQANSSFIVQIEQASRSRIEELAPLEKKSKNRKDFDLERKRSRASTPKEVFLNSLEILKTRFVELPALANKLQILFNKPPQDIRWEPDASETEFQSRQENFFAASFSLSESDSAELNTAIEQLIKIYTDEQPS